MSKIHVIVMKSSARKSQGSRWKPRRISVRELATHPANRGESTVMPAGTGNAPPVCVKRTSSFGADERRCKRGIIATCYYLFVGRLVTRVGHPLTNVGEKEREGGRAGRASGGLVAAVGRESISGGFVCANHRAVVVGGARAIRV